MKCEDMKKGLEDLDVLILFEDDSKSADIKLVWPALGLERARVMRAEETDWPGEGRHGGL